MMVCVSVCVTDRHHINIASYNHGLYARMTFR